MEQLWVPASRVDHPSVEIRSDHVQGKAPQYLSDGVTRCWLHLDPELFGTSLTNRQNADEGRLNHRMIIFIGTVSCWLDSSTVSFWWCCRIRGNGQNNHADGTTFAQGDAAALRGPQDRHRKCPILVVCKSNRGAAATSAVNSGFAH